MSERTVIAVVTDLMKSGLTVEQQIGVAEIAYLKGLEFGFQAGAAATLAERRENDRERQRASRMSRMSRDKRKEPKENNIYNNPKGGSRGDASRDKFDEFWAAYPRKIAKGSAAKAYRNALKRAAAEEILAGVKRYKPDDPQFTKHAATWLNADCWLDEAPKPNGTVAHGPWKPFTPVAADPIKPPPEDRERQLQRLMKARAM